MCGGTSWLATGLTPAGGLSPRVRGNPYRFAMTTARERSIPACAGEPSHGEADTMRWRVYPRVCGGTPYCFQVNLMATGLSPRVRGNLQM